MKNKERFFGRTCGFVHLFLFKPFHFFLQDCVCCQLFFLATLLSKEHWNIICNMKKAIKFQYIAPLRLQKPFFCTMKKETEIQKFPFLVCNHNVLKWLKRSHLNTLIQHSFRDFQLLVYIFKEFSAVYLDSKIQF